ncbi:MAG TPA: NADPH:quinone oxidoreductase family protein [Burkholderiales bacterium]|nr:NADPH:quinone oxidoreductase family protein [Burkholderiales bacterium]
MKALLCKAYGGPETLVLEELPSPRPAAGEVVIDVKAAGVNFPDVLIIQNKYQVKPPLPFAPGAELAGVIQEVGAGVTGFKPGDRVIAMTTWGAFAEECVARAEQLIRMPNGLDFPTAAAFTLTYGTSWHALKDRGQLRGGETLLVLGAAGGVGIAAIEIGKALGARVIAAASSPEKLAVCRAHGADGTIDYAAEDLRTRLKAIAGEKGVDVVFDPVGGPYAEPAIRSTGWRGRYLIIGFAHGEIPRIPLNLMLLKGSSLVGVYWGDWTRREPQAAAAAMEELLDWLAAGKLKPHLSGRYPLARAGEALAALASRKVAGKLVVEPEA